jgi:hypothetical protein
MGVLYIGDDEKRQIEQALALARARPMPFAALCEIAAEPSQAPHLKLADLADRKAGVERVRAEYPTYHVRLGSYDAAISFEYQREQKLFRHLSVSSANEGLMPGPEVFGMIAEAFGFSGFPPTRPYQVWIEEYAPGCNAINLVELVDGA